MQYIITFVWAFILVHMINFVLMSLGGGDDLNLAMANVMAVVFAILVLIITAVMPNDPVNQEHH